jgi:hypothetical protein
MIREVNGRKVYDCATFTYSATYKLLYWAEILPTARDASKNERKAWCHADPASNTDRCHPEASLGAHRYLSACTDKTSSDSIPRVTCHELWQCVGCVESNAFELYSRRLVGLGSPVIESIAHVRSRSSRKVVACCFRGLPQVWRLW